MSLDLLKAENKGFPMRYMTSLYLKYFLRKLPKTVEICLKKSRPAGYFFVGVYGFTHTPKLINVQCMFIWIPRVSGQSRFFEANFDGFWQFSQKVFKVQKFYIPCWKALVSSFQKLYQHRVWLSPKNRYAPFNESQTKKSVADK